MTQVKLSKSTQRYNFYCEHKITNRTISATFLIGPTEIPINLMILYNDQEGTSHVTCQCDIWYSQDNYFLWYGTEVASAYTSKPNSMKSIDCINFALDLNKQMLDLLLKKYEQTEDEDANGVNDYIVEDITNHFDNIAQKLQYYKSF
jgi:hypothetical protein